jgi:hypothetical protein
MAVRSGWVAPSKEDKYEKKCPMCWNGLCQKHPRQDHGASLNFISTDDKRAILSKVYEDKIGQALKKKLEEAKMNETDEMAFVRVSMALNSGNVRWPLWHSRRQRLVDSVQLCVHVHVCISGG